MKNCFVFAVVLSTLICVGCGDKVGLQGKVTYSDDGSPLTTGVVCFETPTYLSRGVIKSDGTYVVGSLSKMDGIPKGTYQVYISGATKEIGNDAGGMPLYESLIDEKFASGSTSGLTLEVTSSMKPFNIKVDRYVPAKQK